MSTHGWCIDRSGRAASTGRTILLAAAVLSAASHRAYADPEAAVDRLQAGYTRQIEALVLRLDMGERLVFEENVLSQGGPALDVVWTRRGNPGYIGGLSLQLPVSAVALPEDGARTFLAQYGEVLGLPPGDSGSDLVLDQVRDHPLGHFRVDFNQEYRGLPVRDARLRIAVSSVGEFISLMGHYVPGLTVDVAPALSADGAVARYAERLEPWGRTVLGAGPATLVVFRTL
jgi:hypothetical protein